jgi:hypothetical protein
MRSEVRLAFLIVWLVLSAVILGILAAPFVLSGDAIARASPVCVWKAKFNRECPGCGLTRSFLHLSARRARDAFSANRAGPALYAAFVANELFLAAWLFRRRASQGGLPCKS